MVHIDQSLENQLILSVIKCQKMANSELESFKHGDPSAIFNKYFIKEYDNLKFRYPDTLIFHEKTIIKDDQSKFRVNNHLDSKTYAGATLLALGQPILKKRFVMAGSAGGTSIASKYLSKLLPQRIPLKIIGTTVLGRAVGRAVPYVGAGLIIIDIIELLISIVKEDSKTFKGFGGGRSGGGGAGRFF